MPSNYSAYGGVRAAAPDWRGEIRVGRTSTLTQRSREWPSTASIALAKVIRHIPAHPVSVSWPRPVRKKRTGVACCMCWTAPRCAIAEHHNVVGQQARDEQQQQRDGRSRREGRTHHGRAHVLAPPPRATRAPRPTCVCHRAKHSYLLSSIYLIHLTAACPSLNPQPARRVPRVPCWPSGSTCGANPLRTI